MPSWSRSQLGTLATNNVLGELGRVFGGRAFTSVTASVALGIDFRTTCQKLSRMSKRPYYLLSVITGTARIQGGLENVYAISQRGWRKIEYLQRKSQPAPAGSQPTAPNFLSKALAAEHLVTGRGTFKEGMAYVWAENFLKDLDQLPCDTDEISVVLARFNPSWTMLDAFACVASLAPDDIPLNRTVCRTTTMQRAGYVPQDINLPLFVHNALRLGSTEPVILIDLLLRGVCTLKKERDLALKILEKQFTSRPIFDEAKYLKQIVKNQEKAIDALSQQIKAGTSFLLNVTETLSNLGWQVKQSASFSRLMDTKPSPSYLDSTGQSFHDLFFIIARFALSNMEAQQSTLDRLYDDDKESLIEDFTLPPE